METTDQKATSSKRQRPPVVRHFKIPASLEEVVRDEFTLEEFNEELECPVAHSVVTVKSVPTFGVVTVALQSDESGLWRGAMSFCSPHDFKKFNKRRATETAMKRLEKTNGFYGFWLDNTVTVSSPLDEVFKEALKDMMSLQRVVAMESFVFDQDIGAPETVAYAPSWATRGLKRLLKNGEWPGTTKRPCEVKPSQGDVETFNNSLGGCGKNGEFHVTCNMPNT